MFYCCIKNIKIIVLNVHVHFYYNVKFVYIYGTASEEHMHNEIIFSETIFIWKSFTNSFRLCSINIVHHCNIRHGTHHTELVQAQTKTI